MIDTKEFLDYWEERGVEVPDPEQYPGCFTWLVRLYTYYHNQENAGVAERETRGP